MKRYIKGVSKPRIVKRKSVIGSYVIPEAAQLAKCIQDSIISRLKFAFILASGHLITFIPHQYSIGYDLIVTDSTQATNVFEGQVYDADGLDRIMEIITNMVSQDA